MKREWVIIDLDLRISMLMDWIGLINGSVKP